MFFLWSQTLTRKVIVLFFVSGPHNKLPDFDGNINYETDSIIYKLVDNYFIPFQSIQLNGVEEWLPLQVGKNPDLSDLYERLAGS